MHYICGVQRKEIGQHSNQQIQIQSTGLVTAYVFQPPRNIKQLSYLPVNSSPPDGLSPSIRQQGGVTPGPASTTPPSGLRSQSFRSQNGWTSGYCPAASVSRSHYP